MQSYVPQSEQSENACNNARLAVACVPTVTATQNFGLAANERRKVQFGAFQTFVQEKAKHTQELGTMLAELPFREAFQSWFESHTPFISERSKRDYRQYANALCEFFDSTITGEINYSSVRNYQNWRSASLYDPSDETSGEKYRHRASNTRIRNEINCVLKPIMKEIGTWDEAFRKRFRHLPLPREGAGNALSIQHWEQVFAVAFERPKWELAGHCLRIMFRGGFQFGELRRVRCKDLDLEAGTISIIVGAKNRTARPRTLMMLPTAIESAQWLMKRLEAMGGGNDPHDFLLPHRSCISTKVFNKPMGSIYRSVRAIVREWALRQPKAAVSSTRPRDCRVSAASLLLKNSRLSLATIERVLGWTPNTAMRKRYYRAEAELIRDALSTLEGKNCG